MRSVVETLLLSKKRNPRYLALPACRLDFVIVMSYLLWAEDLHPGVQIPVIIVLSALQVVFACWLLIPFTEFAGWCLLLLFLLRFVRGSLERTGTDARLWIIPHCEWQGKGNVAPGRNAKPLTTNRTNI